MCEGNYIKLNRKILEWGWYTDTNTFKLFLHLLLSANYKDGEFLGIQIMRGQALKSISKLSFETGLTVQNVRTAINHLKSTREITCNPTKYGQLITIEKYALYQSNEYVSNTQPNRELTSNQQGANRELTSNQQGANNILRRKESKESKKERVLRESKDSLSQSDQIAHGMEANVEAIPLTDGTEWRPTVSEYDEYCRLYPSVDVFDSFRRMRAWSLSNPTKKKTRNGVKRFVNTWLSKEQDNSGKASTKGSGSAYIDAIHNRMDVVDRWLERTEGDDKAGVYNAGEGDEGRVF